MPINYYGPHEERIKRITEGSIWQPRTENETARKLPPIQIYKVLVIPEVDWKNNRVLFKHYDLESAVALSVTKRGKNIVVPSMTFQSLLTTYRREDETFILPGEPRVRVTRDFADRFEEQNKIVLRLHQRVINLENFLRALGYSDEN